MDAFVRLEGICDLKVEMQNIGMVTHLVIRPVGKAEITAQEIRTRLKTSQQSEKTQQPLLLEAHKKSQSSEEEKISATSKPISTESSLYHLVATDLSSYRARYSQSRAARKQAVFKSTIGLHCSSVVITMLDESTTGEISEILSFYIDDLFLASFPLSHNLSFIGSEKCFAVSVGYAQLDNQLYGKGCYDFPVIFLPQNITREKGSPAEKSDKSSSISPFHFSSSVLDGTRQMTVMETLAVFKSKSIFHAQLVTFYDPIWNQSSIESVECAMRPFSLYVEDVFLFRLIEEYESFAVSKLAAATSGLHHDNNDRSGIIVQHRLPSAAYFNSCMMSQPFRIRQLTVHQIQMLLSVHASLKLFLASDQTPLNLAKFERTKIFSSTQKLLNAVTVHYASAAIFRAGEYRWFCYIKLYYYYYF